VPRDFLSPLGDTRAQVLDDLAKALSHASDFDSVVRAGAEAVAPGFADSAILLIQRDHQLADCIEVVHPDAGEAARLAEALRPMIPTIRRVAKAEVRRGRQFRWIPRVVPAFMRFLSREPALVRFLDEWKAHSLMVVPLRAGGTILGGMAFAQTADGKPFRAGDLAIAQIIARRIGVAVQAAELQGRTVDEESRRARLETALQKWIRVFDRAGWGAAIVDGQDQRIESVNPAFAALHGYPNRDSLGGRLFTEVLAADRVDEPGSWPTDAELPAYESLHRRADGVLFPVLTNVTPLTTDSGTTSYVVTVQDLTELKRAEERLRRAQRLEAAGRLAGGVAHEVNNMMTIILGFGDLLARSAGLPADRQREIEEIRKAATRAGKITQQLLAFSRQQILQPADLELNDVITKLVPMLQLLLPANIELETTLAPISATVRADRAQLEQVIINLAFNGRDAMAEGGLLRITTGSRRLGERDGRRLIGIPIPAGQYALVSVIDTGHGMDPNTLMQVFEPFFTTKPLGSGTGLGLATVYGIVKQSGGYVWVESTPGRGTTMTFCLPEVERRVPAVERDEPALQPIQCRAGTVLIVEDEEGVRQLAHQVLEQQGHHVIEARDGETATQVLREFASDLDLVLSDVIVPGIGTAELERAVRDRRPDLPILYMSGYSRDEMMERGLVAPERPFLQKPFTAAELSQLVCRELEPKAGPVVER
jgi:two-component system, cell cycle sensor histidine kinase and response regulator CckA